METISNGAPCSSYQSRWLTDPFAGVSGLRMDPSGGNAPLSLEKCTLVIPPLESAEMCLKMIASAYYEMGRVIHQFAQDGFSEEPPKNEESVLIFAEFRVQLVL